MKSKEALLCKEDEDKSLKVRDELNQIAEKHSQRKPPDKPCQAEHRPPQKDKGSR